MKEDFVTPVGRLVQGNPFEAQTTNMQGQPLMTMAGQPTQRYFVAVAFAKTDQAFAAFYQKLVNVARAGFPQLFNAQGQCSHPRFSWKLIDGDGVDDNGKPNSSKPGFAGHWVVKFSSSFAPKCFYAGRYQPQDQIQDPNAIPRGYYVRITGSIEGNNNPQKPGLYVNLSGVELVGGSPSDIIQTGPDMGAIFSAAGAAQLPPGVAAAIPGAAPQMGMMPGAPAQFPQGLPMAAPAAAPGLPGVPLQQGAPMGLPQVPSAAPGIGGMPAMPGLAPAPAAPAMMSPANVPPQPLAVAPNPAFLAGPGAAPGAAMPGVGIPAPQLAPALGAMPAAPSSPQVTPAAAQAGHTYQSLRAAGYDDAALRANGYIV